MKKLLLVSIIILLATSLFAQKKGSFNIQESNTVGSFDKDWGCNIYDVSFSYLWNIGKVFHIGAGAGVGYSNPIKYYSGWKVDADMSQATITFPVFARLKVDFGTKPTHAYFSAKAGTRAAFVEGFDGENFNPYTANVVPAIGVDINVGDGNKLFIEAGLDANFSKYQQIEYTYSDVLKKYVYDHFENMSDGLWAGAYFSIGFSF